MKSWKIGGRLAVTALSAALLLAMTSCASPETESPSVVRFNSADMHAAHSMELLPVMHELTRLTVVEPGSLEASTPSTKRQRRKARSILKEVASSAMDIPDYLETTTMPLEHQALFRHMSRELSDAAGAFRSEVGTLPPAEIQLRFADLQQKCDACHRKFRIAPYPVSGGVPFD